MDSKAGGKSRKELRKEARLEKAKRKFDSWINHHQSRKLNKFSSDPKSRDLKILQKDTLISKERESVAMDLYNGSDCSFEQPTMLENSEFQSEEAFRLNKLNSLEDVKSKKGLNRKSKTKFEKYLQEDFKLENEVRVSDEKIRGNTDAVDTFDEEILSVRDPLEREQTVEVSRKNDSSIKKRQERKSSKDRPNGDSSTSSVSKVSTKKKTKFEEYVEMDMKGGGVSAEDDFALERKLAKKLKVKGGKFRTNDDEINMLFEGIPSVFDSLETEEEATEMTVKNSSVHKKRKKKSSEQERDAEVEGDTVVGVSEPTLSPSTDVAFEKRPTKVNVMGGNAKYVPPQQRSLSKNESVEHSQIRKHIRGLLNKLSESNIEAITREMSTIFHSVGRSIGAQIVSEEVLSSCSGGPRGNEQ